jgi:lipopolysaccharide biosynthesis glycosyltransferase
MQDSNQPIVVALSADDNYAMPMAVTLRSLLSNLATDRTVQIYILDGGIKEDSKQKILSIINSHRATLHWVRPSDAVSQALNGKIVLSEKWPLANFYRLLLPSIVPQDLQKIIYLDTDVVVQGDLSQLWDFEMGDRHLLAVTDVCDPLISGTGHLTYYKDFGIADDCRYFNAGVLVINLEKWRTEKVADQVLDFMEDYSQRILFPDQDALNIILAGKWGELSPQWNQMHAIYNFTSWKESPYSEADYQVALQNPAMVHYTTVPKPWQAGCVHPQQHLFYQYLDATPWAGWRNTVWRRAGRRVLKEIKQLSGLRKIGAAGI